MLGEDEEKEQQGDAEHESVSVMGEDEMEVILNTLSHSVNPRIFRIMAKHGTKALVALIDTGSNNNFIQEALVDRLGLKYERATRFQVYMGNGQYLVCDKKCVGVELVLQGTSFEVDLFVLPIWGLDVVLGMQWLQTLGPCLHDHNELTMEFQWQGKQVPLVSSPMIYTRQVPYSQINVLVQGGQISRIFSLKVVGV